MIKNKIHYICLIVIGFIFSGCMTLNKTSIEVMSRDITHMPLNEKLESCSWILSQYPEEDQIREKRAILYYQIGLYSYSFDDCEYLLDSKKASGEIVEIYNELDGDEIEIDEEKFLRFYDNFESGYSEYFKGLFYIQCEMPDKALEQLISAVKNLPKGYFKQNACELAGDIYRDNQSWINAITYYRKAAKIYSGDPYLHTKMFEIYLKLKNIKQAKKELKIIQKLTGDNQLYENAVKKLEA